MLDLIVQQFGQIWVGSGMQVDRRTGGVMVMSLVVQVRLAVWVGGSWSWIAA